MMWEVFNNLMETKKPTFTAVVDFESKWFEITETFEDAVTLLRDLVEADHHHVFIGVTTWHQQSHGKNASIACRVQWVDTLDNSHYNKTIRVNGITYGDCDFWAAKKFEESKKSR